MITDRSGNKITAQVRAKIILQEYLDNFDLSEHDYEFDNLVRTEPDKVQGFVEKLIQRMSKALVVK